MNAKELKSELDRLGVPRRVYSLSGWRDERLCLEERSGTWHVFFVERGGERPLREFQSENDACHFMLEELKLEI
ncbi:hypothetical protein E6A55_20345 [Cupriavidus necator H16]|uniref:Uncharacterized protein n=1 Tax=Cupriavidus necator (strain ATCC 17699 / DSM 428 / KCTC 22496 / NCIMB 10442 / H16 / Stanier 337) TaxID=381666 RepID=A0AAE6DI89_CUPNH|nr:hypothetical protein [Cupriavidus necator]QCC02982.1 hypothetical protein E6A55_20345 [Cupriavidus necator H16]QQB80039.1 hypothetical protein I6H87_19955 [Cupriavidus necator]WKA44294.1 hypothetical protein QWP09_20380 [Cupriavidus necator]